MKVIRNYVIASYLTFWCMVMGICGTASMVFHASPLIMRILSNVCAWSPTIVLFLGFRYFVPGSSVKDFYRKAFNGKVSSSSLIFASLITIGVTLLAVFLLSLIQAKAFSSYWSLGTYPFWASVIFAITTGPTGEESGWRAYVRPHLNSKYNFFKSCVIQGLIWAFWHTVLWFVDSDFVGIQMIPYVLSNVIVMTGLCFIMNFFIEKHDNLIYGIAVHFCFNFLYCFLKVDIFFYIILSILYLCVIAVICMVKKTDPC